MLNAMVYSAVVVVQMMKIVQRIMGTVYLGQVKPDTNLKNVILFLILHYYLDIMMLVYWYMSQTFKNIGGWDMELKDHMSTFPSM